VACPYKQVAAQREPDPLRQSQPYSAELPLATAHNTKQDRRRTWALSGFSNRALWYDTPHQQHQPSTTDARRAPSAPGPALVQASKLAQPTAPKSLPAEGQSVEQSPPRHQSQSPLTATTAGFARCNLAPQSLIPGPQPRSQQNTSIAHPPTSFAAPEADPTTFCNSSFPSPTSTAFAPVGALFSQSFHASISADWR
jgi:hypothetical protein